LHIYATPKLSRLNFLVKYAHVVSYHIYVPYVPYIPYVQFRTNCARGNLRDKNYI